ncbi:carbohydrate ABC transporter permease [Nonomuraea gerenzanensis]|uniref:Sugar ABC transporter, permease protein n=1 Tax=Nonomuraea gerenzanensis TaxID=93944 RepID=A0A1M4DZM3_9ACTN|nr:carbohydrate ABC transporter permease [Nonomuraea gerenzanensis]UBU14300.1 carbohydrate ABC transporter permease [Nonomuraea gerenzanensis]SBO92001.1 Sugar ABC transporter, permease protein [Nonomuraea gerenzanensis]
MAVKTMPAQAKPHHHHARTGRGAARRAMPKLKTVLIAATAYVVALLFLFPYVVMLLTSLRSQESLRDVTFWPDEWVWSNLTDFWGSGLAGNLWVTIKVAAGSTLLVLLVALPAAYYSARHNFRGRTAFLILVLITQMFQPTAMVVGIYREFFQFGLVDSIWALILVNGGFNLAFAVWILNAYFSSIPRELEEAAFIDGNGRFGALFRITLPLAMPGVITALIFTFIAAWNEFVVALTLTTTTENQPLPVALNSFIGQYQVDWQNLFAGSVIATIPVIILFALIERKVVGGLTAGSIK